MESRPRLANSPARHGVGAGSQGAEVSVHGEGDESGQSDAHAVSHGRGGHGELPLSVSGLWQQITKKAKKNKNETSRLSLALFRHFGASAVTHSSVQVLTHQGKTVLLRAAPGQKKKTPKNC